MLRSNVSGQSSQPITLVIEVGDVDLDACKIFINRGKGAKDRYILFPASFRLGCSKATCTPRRAIDIYSRLGGSGRSRHAESSKLCKDIAKRPALRSRCTRICSAIRC